MRLGIWTKISYNPNLSIKFLKKYEDEPLDWEIISDNIKQTVKIIEAFPDKPWDWLFIDGGKNMTVEEFEKYAYKYKNYFGISRNFMFYRRKEIKKEMKKYLQ